MLNKTLLSVSIVSMVIGTSYGSVNNTITSKGYVDTEIETKQLTIPVTGTNSSNAGNTVVTYTSTEGTLGERGLYTGANTYDAETDADKLITASALNTAFTTLPTLETNRLACANPGTCDLWTITPQTAYGRAAAPAIDLSALVNATRAAMCYASLSGGGKGDGQYDDGCTTARTNYGDWGTVFEYNNSTIQINGISACSAVKEKLSYGGIPTNQSGVQADYESNMAAAPTNSPVGGYCYCKLTDPETSNARWVYINSQKPSGCADSCARHCAAKIQGAVFGVQ